MKVQMTMEKATKNTIRCTEVLENDLAAPMIGTIDVPKSTLGAIGWKEGKTLTVELGTEG